MLFKTKASTEALTIQTFMLLSQVSGRWINLEQFELAYISSKIARLNCDSHFHSHIDFWRML